MPLQVNSASGGTFAPKAMLRVLVIGSGGAGKSTFATRLGALTGLPVIHLDAYYWRPNWVPTPEAEWHARVDALLVGERWIMDGNYGGTLERRLARADTVIFLDLPRWRCLARVLRRWLRYRGRSRPSAGQGCPERLHGEFLRWIWGYPRRRRAGILQRLAALRPDQQAVILRSPAAVEAYLRAVHASCAV
jgi:adenylate kinase family enzyme